MTFTRRVFVSSLAGVSACLAADKSQTFPSEVKRYSDPATEFVVLRLTDPAHQSWLSAPYDHCVSRHNDFLIHASDRSGTVQAYRLDLKNGQSRILTEASDLAADSLTLTPDERDFCYLAGGSLHLARINNPRAREVYNTPAGFTFGRGFSLSEDGLFGALVEQNGQATRLRLINMRTGSAVTLAESSVPLSDLQIRPKRAGVLYRRGNDELWLVNFDAAQNHKLRLAAGGLGPALWSADGRTVLYLNFPADPKQLHNIREFTPDSNDDRKVSETSQFVTFNRNGDSSVFVGASGSKASPYILLLVRSVKRELTLCEHLASDPRQATVLFSPNSQRVFFQSDRDGKMAIYSLAVDRLVAETETEEP